MTEADKDFHARLRVVEEWKTETRELLHGMNVKLDTITATLSRMGEIRHCPMPGACIELNKEVGEMKREHKATMEAMDKRLVKLERIQTFFMGVVATISVLWGIVQVVIPWIGK